VGRYPHVNDSPKSCTSTTVQNPACDPHEEMEELRTRRTRENEAEVAASADPGGRGAEADLARAVVVEDGAPPTLEHLAARCPARPVQNGRIQGGGGRDGGRDTYGFIP
jgi:hypothetical protein